MYALIISLNINIVCNLNQNYTFLEPCDIYKHFKTLKECELTKQDALLIYKDDIEQKKYVKIECIQYK